MGISSIAPPPQVDAEVFHREMRNGRNGAVLVGVSWPDGRTAEAVVKLAARLKGFAPVPYLLEWLATALGNLLGIRIPEPLEVMISSDFALSLSEPMRSEFAKSIGSAYGSWFYPAPFMQWTKGELLPMELRQAAAELLAFDVFIHNPDRRIDNPNVFTSKQEVLAFDHDAAFSFIFPLLGQQPDPAEDALLTMLPNHVFSGLFGRRLPSLGRFREAVRALTDNDFDHIVTATPPAWRTGLADGKLETIISVMRRRRDAIDKWLPLVESWIQK